MLRLARVANPVWIEQLPLLLHPAPSRLQFSTKGTSSNSTEPGDAALRPGTGGAAQPAPDASSSSGKADSANAASRVRTALKSTLKNVNERAKSANELLHALRALEPLAPTAPDSAGRVVALHVQSLLQNYGRLLALAAFSGATYTLWGALGELSVLLGAPATPATSYLALAGALASVAGGGAYVRALYTLHPAAAYRAALLQLNTSPAVLEVMGAPLAGLGPRVTIVSSGGLAWGSGWPRPRAARVLLAFPLRGSECRGLALVEAKRLMGRVVVKALAVDVPGPGGREERIYVAGEGGAHSRDVIFNEMRQPLIKVVALREEYAREDDLDASCARAEAERARLAAARLKAERRAAAEASAKVHREAALRARAEAAAAGAAAAGAAEAGSSGGSASSSSSGTSQDGQREAGAAAGAASERRAEDRNTAVRPDTAAAAAAPAPASPSGEHAGAPAATPSAGDGPLQEQQQQQPTGWWPWRSGPAAPADASSDTKQQQQPGKP